MSDTTDNVPVEPKLKLRKEETEFFGHPMGLWVLFTTEMWERFCYYGMRAFLVLYLISSIRSSNPGFGWSEESAYELYGWFTGSVYLLPVLGGYIADRFIGQHRSVLWGGVLIALGEFCLFLTEYFRMSATEAITFGTAPGAWLCFMGGLALIVIGTGFFKPCISIMVGQLYPQTDDRRDVAYTVFYMGINLGALIAPFAAGTMAEKYGWHWGFLIAAIGMVFGLITYSLLRPYYLGHIGFLNYVRTDAKPEVDAVKIVETKTGKDTEKTGKDVKKTGQTAEKPETPNPTSTKFLTRKEIDRIAVILILSTFTIAFWSVFEQAGSSLNTFAKRDTNRQVPTALAQAFPKPFLANEDEREALITFDNAKLIMVEAVNAMEILKEKMVDANTAFLKSGTSNSDVLKAATEYHNRSNEATEMITTAKEALARANDAREKAGLAPFNPSIPTPEQLLKQGQEKMAVLDKQVTETCKKNLGFDIASITDEKELPMARKKWNNEAAQIRNAQLTEIKKNTEKEIDALFDKKNTLYSFPATWYQSVNPIGIVLFAPFFAMLWGFLARRKIEPSTPVKFGIGLVVLSIAFLILIPGALQAQQTGGNAASYWLLGTYVFCTWGELCLSPVGLSMVSRLAPARYASLLMGIWHLASAVANYVAAKLASVFGTGAGDSMTIIFGKEGGLADFMLLLALIPMITAVIVFLFAGRLRTMMHENE